jgi:hypothetical protein
LIVQRAAGGWMINQVIWIRLSFRVSTTCLTTNNLLCVFMLYNLDRGNKSVLYLSSLGFSFTLSTPETSSLFYKA